MWQLGAPQVLVPTHGQVQRLGRPASFPRQICHLQFKGKRSQKKTIFDHGVNVHFESRCANVLYFCALVQLVLLTDFLICSCKYKCKKKKSGDYKAVEIKGLPASTDRALHGLDFYEKSPSELVFFVINHRRGGSVVEVLEYQIGDDFVQYKETVKHELILTPNDIVAMGPRSFYVSNDHKYAKGVMRAIERMFTPFRLFCGGLKIGSPLLFCLH